MKKCAGFSPNKCHEWETEQRCEDGNRKCFSKHHSDGEQKMSLSLTCSYPKALIVEQKTRE